MILPPGSTRTKRNLIEVLLIVRNALAAVIGRNTECICIMCFRQIPCLAEHGCLVAKQRGKGNQLAESSIEVAFALHCPLGYLIQMSTDPLHFERHLAIVDLMVTGFTQAQQVLQGIFPPMLTIDNVMSFQASVFLATVLALITIAH